MARAIEFLLRSQAKNDAQIGVLTDRVNTLTDRVDRLTEQVTETHRLMQLHAETQTEFTRVVTRSLAALNDAVARVNEKVDATDARLDRLSEAFERFVNDRGRQPPGVA